MNFELRKLNVFRGGSRLFVKGGGVELACMSILHFLAKKKLIL